ncbi:MAG: HEPN domain-containing protein [Pseudomonadota bacterium]|nr:HEPN domain-containing protein [Pseudomonadota bacterium]
MAKMPSWIREALQRHVRSLAPVPPAARIFRAAREYHEAALRCYELRQNDGQMQFLPYQGLVLQAFASELYLKALFVIEKGAAPGRGHNLNVLFKRLGSATKESISERYHIRYEDGELATDLEAFALVFQEWRYSHEFSGAHEMDQMGIAQLASTFTKPADICGRSSSKQDKSTTG